MTGANAGEKIATAIAQLPSWGGYVDATGFPSPQNLIGFTVPKGVMVQLPHGFFTLACGSPITVNDGAKLKGRGVNSPGATTIKLFNNCNHDVVKAVSVAGEEGWWHNAEISDIRIDGNKANNPTGGNGLSVYSVGETSTIHHILTTNNAKAGIFIKGSQAGTGSVENVTAGNNGLAGFHIDDFQSGLLLKSVGGDFNPSCFLITNTNNGGGSLMIEDMKCEGTPENGYPIHFAQSPTSAVMNLTIKGGSAIINFGAAQTFIRIDPIAIAPAINIEGLTLTNGWTTLIDDRANDVLIPSLIPGNYIGTFHYRNGKWMKFDLDGFQTYPAMLVTQP
jgi:hypothetical protein